MKDEKRLAEAAKQLRIVATDDRVDATDEDVPTRTQRETAANLAALVDNLRDSVATVRELEDEGRLVTDGGVDVFVEDGCNCAHLPDGSFCVECRELLDRCRQSQEVAI